MRRLLVAMMLLAGISSCTPVDRVAPQGFSTRPTPPSQATWTSPTGRPASAEQAAEPATEPTPAPARPPVPAQAAMAAQRPGSPSGANLSLPGTVLPAATSRSEADLGYITAYANAEGSGSGPVPGTRFPLSSPLSSASAGQEPPAGLQAAAAPLPAAAPPPAAAPLPQASVSETLLPDRAPVQVASALYIEKRPDPPAIETHPATPAALPVILMGSPPPPAAPPSTPPAPENAASGAAIQLPVVEMEQPTAPVSAPAPTAPTIPLLRVVNSKRITLNFELKDSNQGMTGVDLWCTRDMRTWKRVEAIRTSPSSYAFEVKEEGLYGFTMIARTSTSPPGSPRSGDLPQVWVTVDATPPVVHLAGVELSLTSKTPALVVRWTAHDKNFHKRPITISYAELSEGPWTELAADVENTGRHEVPLLATLPKRVFLRMETHDLAGNVGRAQTAGAIRLELPWANSTTTVQAPEATSLLPPPPSPEMARPPQVAITGVEGEK